MVLYLAADAAHLILQLPAGLLEGIVDSECQIAVALVRRWRSSYIDLSAVRQGKTNMNFIKSALAMMPSGSLHDNAAGRYSTPALFELADAPRNGVAHLRRARHALKVDLGWRLHLQYSASATRYSGSEHDVVDVNQRDIGPGSSRSASSADPSPQDSGIARR